MLSRFCCLRLSTAAMIIGWIGATFSFIAVILVSVGLGNLDELVKAIMEQVHNSEMTAAGVRSMLLILLCVYLTINLINLISSALLIMGTVKERHLLLVPWLLNAGVSLIFSILYYIFYIIMIITNKVNFGSVVVSLLFSGLALSLQYYIWFAIYSLYKQIQASRDQQQHLLRPAAGSAGPSYPSYTKI